MSLSTISMGDTLLSYLRQVSLREQEVLRALREETCRLPNAGMQISPEQGQLMALLVQLIQARRVLEIGTFTGYSSTVMALALPPEGELVACDVSDEYTQVARKYWKQAGVDGKCRLHLGDARETLRQLLGSGAQGTFDLAFIDADKSGYLEYYEGCLKLIRPGGLILVDNVLWGGQVADSSVQDSDTEAIRRFNTMLSEDSRIDLSLIPIGDGLTLARKR
ncbi:MAG: O-methyltransferase [bacterium]